MDIPLYNGYSGPLYALTVQGGNEFWKAEMGISSMRCLKACVYSCFALRFGTCDKYLHRISCPTKAVFQGWGCELNASRDIGANLLAKVRHHATPALTPSIAHQSPVGASSNCFSDGMSYVILNTSQPLLQMCAPRFVCPALILDYATGYAWPSAVGGGHD